MEDKTVTIKDVAQAAGVHASTVSLCLNNSPLVAEKTRQRVQQIAREMGYRPHPHLSALMRSRRKRQEDADVPALGFVTFHPAHTRRRTRYPALQRTLDGARQKAHSRGFRLEEVWIPLESFSREKALSLLKEQGISGALLTPLPMLLESLDWPWEQVASVAIGTSLREPRMHRIRCNQFKTMTMALTECYRLGYRRPGLALPEEVNRRTDHRWLASYLVSREELGLTDAPDPLCAEDWNREVFLQWVATSKPDIVLTNRADQALRWLKSHGLPVPDAIGLVNLSNSSEQSRFSGIYEHWELQGERAVTVLIDLLIDDEFGLQDSPVISIVDGSWNPGKTLRPVQSPP